MLMSVSILCLFFLINPYQIMIYLMIMTLFLLAKGLINNAESFINFFFFDLMSLSMVILTVWISILMIMASKSNNNYKNKIFNFYLLLMMNLLFICFMLENLLMFYLFFEAVLFPIILMISGWGSQPERIQAGFYMLMYTVFGSLPLLILMLLKNQSLSIIFNEWLFNEMGFIFFLMILGFLVKIPMFLFHLWLPKAHVEAPRAGSMILAGVLLKLGFYGLYRFKSFFFLDLLKFSFVLIVISMWGAVLISIFCLYQNDIKSLIAYSSVSHMGITLAGCVTFQLHTSFGMLMMMIGHGLCSSGLFCLKNMIYERLHTRSIMMIKGMINFPNLSMWWFLFSIINMSAPMTMNLFGELFLGLGLMKYSLLLSLPVMMMIFLSACYSMFMYSYINHGQSWMIFSNKMISMREYYLMLLHIIPMIMWFLKINFFMKWI
uniref:NADH-ubiquinone oxidoreductase chain 4 n=1 Tax=Rhipicephalus sanguineus TaxID=34632 RepID=NU4M_RHISA|nr:NADH dehydrogenase subunit 4 [Rhipicephalus sanguineus]O99825.1 RecName: Full=NADH-ubiquinone oxidoreductase chain 4; AltName: Full=NADH dehydrogenase subunit 4 [Rhipicephalus sanguineus]AAD05526.1 NADH dehydrogenase 4 [Rhipicephalus sanguineus]